MTTHHDVEKEGSADISLKEESAAPASHGLAFYEPANDRERELDRKINRKLDIFVTVLLGVAFCFTGIDKTNIGNAATTTFIEDANLHRNDIGNATSLFAVTFVVLQPFSALFGRYIGPKYWMSALIATWGAITMGHAAIDGRPKLIALRLLLGAAEAGFYPTAMYYISTMFPRFALATRIGAVSALFVVGSSVSGLIAYGVFNNLSESRFHDWQLLFLIEGGATIAIAVMAILILPRDLRSAWFLTPEERLHAVHRVNVDWGISFDKGESPVRAKTSWVDIKAALTDWPKLAIIVCNMVAIIPVTAFGVFMPLMVQGMGYTGISANLMAVPPFVLGAIGVVAAVILSDRYKDRSLIASFGCFTAVIGLVVMVASQNPKLRYGFTNLCLLGTFVAGPMGLSWLISNTPTPGKRAAMIGFNGIANLASVVGGQIFQAKYKPGYHYPLTITLGLLVFPLLGYPAIRCYYMWLNAKRRRMQAAGEVDNKTGDDSLNYIYGY